MSQTGAVMPSPGGIPGMSNTFGSTGSFGPATDAPGAFGSTGSSFGGTGIPMNMSMSSSMSSSLGNSALPTIGSGMSASLLSGGGETGGGQGGFQQSASLPQLSPTKRRRRLSVTDKAKLQASPFARTRRSVDEEEAIGNRKNVKTDKTVGMTGGKMLKEAARLAGATIRGDAHALQMLRADHAVDRKMSTQAWTDPNAKTGVERGMSTLGLVLDRAHELQGPTGWSSDDLRRKVKRDVEPWLGCGCR
jgi:hypothetical protein